MQDSIFDFKYQKPIIGSAIHSGHELRSAIKNLIGLSETALFHEEDPLTEFFTAMYDNRIVQVTSRFEFDVNRNPQKSVYQCPADCWGLAVYPNGIDPQEIQISQKKYQYFYEQLEEHIKAMINKFPKVFIWDFHSFNNRDREDISSENDFSEDQVPDICIGYSNVNPMFKTMIQKVTDQIKAEDFFGKSLSVAYNHPFPGGYFAQYLHHYYPEHICVISIEFNKRIFMKNTEKHYDEADAQVDLQKLYRLKSIIDNTQETIEKGLALIE